MPEFKITKRPASKEPAAKAKAPKGPRVSLLKTEAEIKTEAQGEPSEKATGSQSIATKKKLAAARKKEEDQTPCLDGPDLYSGVSWDISC